MCTGCDCYCLALVKAIVKERNYNRVFLNVTHVFYTYINNLPEKLR